MCLHRMFIDTVNVLWSHIGSKICQSIQNFIIGLVPPDGKDLKLEPTIGE